MPTSTVIVQGRAITSSRLHEKVELDAKTTIASRVWTEPKPLQQNYFVVTFEDVILFLNARALLE